MTFDWVLLIPISILLIFIFAGIFDYFWVRYSSGQRKWESIMKPCPKCGHKAIIVWYNGENNPQFYQPECGAYSRRESERHNFLGEISPEGYFNDQPPMTDKQKECKYLAGYCNDEKDKIGVPHFRTPRAAAIWWNRVGCRTDDR